MPFNYLFFVSLLCVFNALVYTAETQSNRTKPLIITRYHALDNTEKIDEETNIFTEEEVEELEFVFDQSSTEAQLIVNHLQNPTFFPGNEDYRSAYFVGDPGSGKTTTARSIGYHMARHGWEYKFLSSTSLLKDYRNQTAIQLNKELESAIASNRPTIIVIDELHRLLENSDSKHHDTDTTATTLWTFLDKQKNNPNFFFIGTMNRITHLPKPFKSRILFDYIEFQLPHDMHIKNAIVRKHLTTKNSCINADVTDDFLNSELKRMGPLSARDLRKLSGMIHRIQKQENIAEDGIVTIQKASVTKAIIEYIRRKEKIQYDLEDEADEERQERHHHDNMSLQKKHHEEQMRIQQENQEIQESHFVQQQMIQIALAEYQERITFSTYSNESTIKAANKLAGCISDEQKQIYANTMANTRAREAAEIAAAQERARIQAEEAKKKSWRPW